MYGLYTHFGASILTIFPPIRKIEDPYFYVFTKAFFLTDNTELFLSEYPFCFLKLQIFLI